MSNNKQNKVWHKENPQHKGEYLCRMENGYIKMCHYDGEEWFDMWKDSLKCYVKEWMYIPYDNSEMSEIEQLRKLAALLQSAWFYGDWKAETLNEHEMEAIMREQGLWPVTMSAETWELNLKLNQYKDEINGGDNMGENNGVNNNPGTNDNITTDKKTNHPTWTSTTTWGKLDTNNRTTGKNNKVNMLALAKAITNYLNDVDSYGDDKQLRESIDVLHDFVVYLDATDENGEVNVAKWGDFIIQ